MIYVFDQSSGQRKNVARLRFVANFCTILSCRGPHKNCFSFFKLFFCIEVFFVRYLPASEASQVKKYFLEDIFASVTQMPGARVGIPVLVPVQTP